MMVSMIPYFILIGVTPHELTNVYFIIPVMNIYALIKQLIYGIYDLTSVLLVVGSSAVFIAITFAIGEFMFSQGRWLLVKKLLFSKTTLCYIVRHKYRSVFYTKLY